MSKHKKNNRSLRSMEEEKSMPLTGVYLKEKELLDELSTKLQKKTLRSDLLSGKADLSYPKIQVEEKNKRYAQILSIDFCGKVSEFTSISQYLNHQIRFTNKYYNAQKVLLSINKTEMMHMQIVCELIVLLGENPNYYYYDDKSYYPWIPQFVDCGTNFVNMILLDINDEYKAIKQYEEHIRDIDDKYIKQILERIIKDEKYHIELLTQLLEENK